MANRSFTVVLAAIVALLVGILGPVGAQTSPSSSGVEHYGPVVQGETWTRIATKYCPGGTTAGINALMNKLRLAVAGSSGSPTLGVGDILHVNKTDVEACLATVPASTTTAPTTTAAPTTTVAPTTTTTTAAPTTTTTQPPPSRFATLPVNATLPSENVCAGQVRSMTENRPDNASFNNTRGNGANDENPRVTGNYVGTTDMIIQWAACKWGLDEDWARAQAAIESWHRQNDTFGDFGTDPSACLPGHPIGADGRPGECPQSIGLLQVRYPFHQTAFENNNAILSTSYNADYSWSLWRRCFNGEWTWLNTVERGKDYSAGDMLGCMGVWFSGRWYTPAAVGYMNRVRDEFYTPRVWARPDFPPAQPSGGTSPSTSTTATATVPEESSTTTPSSVPSTTTSTTTAPSTSSSTTAPPSDGFLANFATPQDFYDRFDTEVHFRANDYDPNASFHGDHSMACEGPTTGRVVHLDADDNDEVFWWCAPNGPDTGHVMTAMGPAGFGYAIVTFKPKQHFANVDKVCVDVNGTDLGGDRWWEMSVIPKSVFDANNGRMDYVTAFARTIDDTALDFPSSAFVYQVDTDLKIRAYQGMEERLFDWYNWGTTDKAARFKHCMVDNGNGTVTLTRKVGEVTNDVPGGVRTLTVDGSFPQGDVVVLIQDSTYDPPKHGSGPTDTTWHWDNVEIN